MNTKSALTILVTGANGYIGSQLIRQLIDENHRVIALVRSRRRFKLPPDLKERIEVIEGDLLNEESLVSIPHAIDAAFYLVHSMKESVKGFSSDEEVCAEHFVSCIRNTTCQQIIYLSGVSRGQEVSEHMTSRHHVEKVLKKSSVPLTVLRAGIVAGAGSASFEILRDLVEKLPIMITPRWVKSRCEPIAIQDVIYYLKAVIGDTRCFGKTFEIGGPEVLSYVEMFKIYAKERGLQRWFVPVPVLTPKLSGLWLCFVTSTNFKLSRALIHSLKVDATRTEKEIEALFPHQCLTFAEAIRAAFHEIEQNAVISSWKDAMVQSPLKPRLSDYIAIPEHGCYQTKVEITCDDRDATLDMLWRIGGENGWYCMQWAWTIFGWIDKFRGGPGLKRGRRSAIDIHTGDALDFWRVILADKKRGHLLLYAEIKSNNERWLEFRLPEGNQLTITASYRPTGLWGRGYWYFFYLIHRYIFHNLACVLARGRL